jgi:hypothetical protein
MTNIFIVGLVHGNVRETRAIIKGDGEKLSNFEMKILKNTYEPVYNVDSRVFERRKNYE